MAFKIKIRSDFPSPLQTRLLRQVCRHRDRHEVYVSHFNRFGLSGARLLLIYFSDEPDSLPFLLKISRFEKAESEYNSTKVLESYVQDAGFAARRIFSANDSSGKKWGAVLYSHQATDRPEEAANPRALRELIYDRKTSLSELRSILNEVFEKLNNAHSRRRPKRVLLQAYFKRYFRKHQARDRIRCVLGPDADSEEIKFLGTQIYNPLRYLDALPKFANLCIAPVHGDLHPDNIIIHRTEIPHIIDFAWAHKSRDVLIDFVLLENSFRFMAFPRPINLADQLRVDKALVHETGFNQVASLNFCSPEHRRDYARLACAIEVIRERARAALGDNFSMQRYLLTQFILLYGLLRYNEYEPYASTRALGLIAARLKKIGLPS